MIDRPMRPRQAVIWNFLRRQTRIASSKRGMAIWREKRFAWMVQSAESPMEFFKPPANRVVERGSQAAIRPSARQVGKEGDKRDNGAHIDGQQQGALGAKPVDDLLASA